MLFVFLGSLVILFNASGFPCRGNCGCAISKNNYPRAGAVLAYDEEAQVGPKQRLTMALAQLKLPAFCKVKE